MDRVFTNRQRPHKSISVIAIGICKNEHTRHLGVFHRDPETREVLFMHLAFHHRLRNGRAEADGWAQPEDAYLSIDPVLNRRRLPHVAAKFRQIWRSNGSLLPYGVTPYTECFDPKTGKFLFGHSRHGLTCATFVLAGFEWAGIRLLDDSSWPSPTEEDRLWHKWVIETLRKTGASADHVQLVSENEIFTRFRPEQVAAAALCEKTPAQFENVEAVSEAVMAILPERPAAPRSAE